MTAPAIERPIVFQVVPGKDDKGQHVFSVIVKRTYTVSPGAVAERCDTDRPLREIDEYYDQGDPEWATVQYESELAPFKPLVDVVVIGKAYAPRGVPTDRMMASVRVGAREKALVVTGDRVCYHQSNASPVFSDPALFKEMEIRYENAYGGKDEKSLSDIPFYYSRNFMGKGVALLNVARAIDGLALPNVEDPNDLLTPERVVIGDPNQWHLQPLPQGFGWRQRTWYPRCALLGVYPAFTDVGTVTAEEQMGMLPANHIALAKQSRLPTYEAHFNNGASYGMSFKELRGDESVALRGLSQEGLLEFSLPGDAPRIVLDIGKGERELEPRLHTVSIRPEDREVDLIWRGAHEYEGYSWLPKMTRLHAEVH